MKALLPLLRQLLMPVLLFAGAVFFEQMIPQLASSWLPLINVLPYVIFSASALLCIQFNQSRILFSLICLLVFYSIFHFYGFILTDMQRQVLMFWMLVNITLLGYMGERSVLSVHSLIRLSVLIMQAGVSIYLMRSYSASVDLVFTSKWIPAAVPLLDWISFSELLLALVVTGGLALLVRVYFQPGPVEAAVLILFAMLVYQMNSGFTEYMLVSFSSVAGLICFMAVLFDSHQMAYRDELTGLKSRRALNQYLTGLGRTYTIAMLDIDHFKKFNDTHGHDVGDQMLKLVASKIDKVTGGGTAFRYGGEEFTVVYPRKNIEDVKAHLEVLREAIESYPLMIRAADRPRKAPQKKGAKKKKSKSLSCTISLGVASRNDKLKTPEEVIKGADKALYRAKKKGRNRLSV